MWSAVRRVKTAAAMTTDRATHGALKRNAALHDLYSGRRCFVICNGPSLGRLDLRPLADEVTIVMNHFNRHPVLTTWKPSVFCMAEPGDRVSRPVVAAMLAELDAGAYVVRLDAAPHLRSLLHLDEERLYAVQPYARAADWADWGWDVDLTRGVPATDETSQLAILVALYLGCSPVYLLGADQDWLSHRGVYKHFYDDASEGIPPEDLSRRPYLEMIEAGVRVWRSHQALDRLARRRAQRVVNATPGSFLDVYPMASFEEALASRPGRT